MGLAISLARGSAQGNQHVPGSGRYWSLTDDIPFAVIERFSVFRVQTGSVLQRTVDDDDDLPGQPIDPFERLGTLPSLCFGEMFQRRDGHLGMRFQQVRKEGCMQSGKPGGLLEGMFRCDNHEKEQIAGANPLKPLTDGDLTFDPSLQGASEHRASPRYKHSDMGGGDDSIGKRWGCPDMLVKMMSSVVYQGQPPCDPTPLGVDLDQRREIDAWIRSREVKCVLPQRIPVLALDCACNPLFLNETKAFPEFSCNI